MDPLINYARNSSIVVKKYISRKQLNPEKNTIHSQIDNWCSILYVVLSVKYIQVLG